MTFVHQYNSSFNCCKIQVGKSEPIYFGASKVYIYVLLYNYRDLFVHSKVHSNRYNFHGIHAGIHLYHHSKPVKGCTHAWAAWLS